MPGPYVFNNNIPQPTDKISDSQPELLQNNQSIQDWIEINHVTFNDTDAGKHIGIQIVESVAPATGAKEIGLYADQDPDTLDEELYFRRQNNGVTIPMTAADFTPNQGWTYLPSGMLIKWGTTTIAAGTGINQSGAPTTEVDYSFGPAFSSVLQVFPQARPAGTALGTDPNIAIYVQTFGIGTFTVRQWRRDAANTAGTNAGAYRISYFALGLP